MERACFYLRIFPGTEAEYDRRHAEIWPELVDGDPGVGHPQLHRLPARHGRLVLHGEGDPDAATAFAVHGPKPANQRWNRYFRDVIAQITDDSGELLWYDEVFHTRRPAARRPDDARPASAWSSTPSAPPSTRRSTRTRGPTSSRPSRRPGSATTPASGAARTSSTTASSTRTWRPSSAGWPATRSTPAGARRSRGSSPRSRTPDGNAHHRRRDLPPGLSGPPESRMPPAPPRSPSVAPVLDALGAHGRARPSGPTGWPWRARVAGTLARRGVEPVVVARDGVQRGWAAPGRRARGRSGSMSCSSSRRWPSRRPTRWPPWTPCPASRSCVWALHETGPRRRRLRPRRHHDPGRDGRGADALQPAVAARTDRSSWSWAGMDDPATVGAGAARRCGWPTSRAGSRRARLGRIGRPLDGYAPRRRDRRRAARRRLGIELVAVDPDEVVDRVSGGRRRRRRRAGGGGPARLDVRGATWSRRHARPVAAGGARAGGPSSTRHGLDGGAFNCHVPAVPVRRADRHRAVLGAGPADQSAGVPFTCTGDILTAVAMLTTKRLGGAAALPRDRGHRLRDRRGRHRQLRRARPGLAGRPAGAAAPAAATAGSAARTRTAACAPCWSRRRVRRRWSGSRRIRDARGGFRFVVARGELTERDASRRPAPSTARSGSATVRWRRPGPAGRVPASTTTARRRRAICPGPSPAWRAHLGIEAVIV